jgi:hypothetical protein
VVNAALVPNQETTLSQHDLDRRRLLKDYRDGVLTMDRLVLKCVGFNTVLYNALLQRFAQVIPLKRKGSNDRSQSDMEDCAAAAKKTKPFM